MSSVNWSAIDVNASPFLERNLSAFRKRYPTQAEEVESARLKTAEYEIAALGENRFACRLRATQQELYPAEGFTRRLEEAFARAHHVLRNGASCLWLAGAGFGYLASHLLEEFEGDFQRGLLLLENRPELILAQFALMDSVELIQSRQAYWAIGNRVAARAAQVIEEERLFYVPTRRLALLQERIIVPDEQSAYRAVMNDHNAKAGSRERLLQAKQARFYRRMQDRPDLERGVAWGFANPGAYAHTPMMKSLMAGFAELGWRESLLETEEGFATRYRIGEHLVENAPDLLLFCNAPSTQYVLPTIHRPRVTLMLDNPYYYSPEVLKEKLGELDCVFYIDKTFGDFFHEVKLAKAQFMPAYPTLMRKGERRVDLHEPIVFVGSHIPTTLLLSDAPPRVREEIESLGLHQIEHAAGARDALNELSPSGETMDAIATLSRAYTAKIHRDFAGEEARVDYFLYAFANSLKRERILEPLLNLGLVIYGPDSWLSFLGERYRSRFRGWLHPHELADVYASAEACLNIHSLQCPTCLNPRDFDIVAAGGLLLSEEVADSHTGLLKPGEEFVLYTTPQEARDQAIALLEDAPRRQALRDAGIRAFQERHHPRFRAQTILETVQRLWKT